jgi:hypothetical protein
MMIQGLFQRAANRNNVDDASKNISPAFFVFASAVEK